MQTKDNKAVKPDSSAATELATFGAGCFWCVEAVFQELRGVISVESGYTGGSLKNPTYEQVCSGATGHAEVCRITFDPSVITYTDLLEVFWQTHDPTMLNRQGADTGTQYRSAIFHHSEAQRQVAERSKAELQKAGIWKDPIVTEIKPCKVFYPAEAYHQDYYSQNQNQPYCRFVIKPKLDKVKKVFTDKMRE